jgi:hypothetical protein
MKMTNNNGAVVGEITTIFTSDGKVITANTMYSGTRVVSQNIAVRDNQGKITTTNTLGGKILP